MCSRLSPSSSGYKSQSQRSDATISPSPSPSPVATMTCSHTQVSSQDLASPESNNQTVMWAVTSISSVPPGSIIINPQTNQPYTNPDGSIYRFDPENPPKFYTASLSHENDRNDNVSPAKIVEISEPSKVTGKNENRKRSQSNKHNGGNNVTTVTHVTNSATSPSLPFTPPPRDNPGPLRQQQQQPQPQQQQTLVKSSSTVQTCNHNQAAQTYATYVPTSEPFNQGVYPPPHVGQQTVMMAPHPSQSQTNVQNNGQNDVFNQNSVYANYAAVPVQQGPVSQTTEITELSGYFMGMSIYDQRVTGDNHSTPPHSYPQPQPSTTNQTNLQNVQTMPQNYWQPPPNSVLVWTVTLFYIYIYFFSYNFVSTPLSSVLFSSRNKQCTSYLHLVRHFRLAKVQPIDNSCTSNKDFQQIIHSMHKLWLLRANRIVGRFSKIFLNYYCARYRVFLNYVINII